MSNLSVIGLLPTGSGKSLTYQIAALLQPGITIVIDPLVSLMKDQYDGLRKASIDSCTFINSTVSDKSKREELMERSLVQFVFLSPERLCIRGFRSRLHNMQDLHVYLLMELLMKFTAFQNGDTILGLPTCIWVGIFTIMYCQNNLRLDQTE